MKTPPRTHNKTPRTDAHCAAKFAEGFGFQPTCDFARQLERELAAMTARAERAEGELSTVKLRFATFEAGQANLRAQLTEARAELAAIKAALNCDLYPNEDAETVARRLYHDYPAMERMLDDKKRELTALRAAADEMGEALEKSGIFSYISKHAHELRRENVTAGHEMWTQRVFDLIQADHNRLESALSRFKALPVGRTDKGGEKQ